MEPQEAEAESTEQRGGGGSAAAADADEAAAVEVEKDFDALFDETKRERDEYLELAQRTRADFENYRKRMAAETQAAATRGSATVARELIEVIDNLERAIEAAGHDPAAVLRAPRRALRPELARGASDPNPGRHRTRTRPRGDAERLPDRRGGPASRPGGRERVGGDDARRLLPGARGLEEGLRR